MKPTIVDELFSGEIKATLTCCFCHKERHVDEKICTLSLPIPEPEYNTFTIIVFPIYEISMKKVVIRLHRDSTFVTFLLYRDNTLKLLKTEQIKILVILFFARFLPIL